MYSPWGTGLLVPGGPCHPRVWRQSRGLGWGRVGGLQDATNMKTVCMLLPHKKLPALVFVLRQGPSFQGHLFYWASGDNSKAEFRETKPSGSFSSEEGKDSGKKTGQEAEGRTERHLCS